MKKTGFSLVELLVTIAILGVIIAVLIPNVSRARRSSQESAAKAIMIDLASQIAQCKVFNEAYPNDVSPMVIPAECTNLSWPSASDLPLNGRVDYENWTWNGGQNEWVGITYMIGPRVGGIKKLGIHNKKGNFEVRNPDDKKNVTYYFGLYAKTP